MRGPRSNAAQPGFSSGKPSRSHIETIMITTMDKIASTREGFIAGLIEAAAADPKVCLVFADSLKAARAIAADLSANGAPVSLSKASK